MISTPCYVTRESLMVAADVKISAYLRDQIEEAIETGSRRVDEFTQRVFYPVTETRRFDWPDWQSRSPSWRFWIPTDDLISVTSITSGGVTIAASDYDLRNGDDRPEPPYNRIEIDLSSDAAFDSGDTHQRSLVVTGRWGFRYDTVAVTTAGEGINGTETSIDLNSSARMGCGDLFGIGTEHMLCTDMTMMDTTQNCTALTASQADQAITGITTGSIEVGETLLVDSERMLVQDVAVGATDTLTVRRAVDGTTLASHSNGANINAPRRMTMTRGAFGTTATTHSNNDPVFIVMPPPMARQLARAYALDQLQQEGSAYARVSGSGDNEREATGRAIASLESRILDSRLARQIKLGAV